MSDNEINKTSQASVDDDTTNENAQKYSAGRRLFLKGATVTAPIVMTVTSRPSWAWGTWSKWRHNGGGKGCSLSGQLSGNLSQPEEECGGEGCSPGYWKNHTSRWHPYFPPDMPFVDVFGVNAFPGQTLYQVMMLSQNKDNFTSQPPPGCDPGEPPSNNVHNYYNILRQLGFHSVAALQNAATSVSFDLTAPEVIDLFVDAYNSCSKHTMEHLKNTLDDLNNQYCPFD